LSILSVPGSLIVEAAVVIEISFILTLYKPVTISGGLGDDAKQYQVRAVRIAIEDSENEG